MSDSELRGKVVRDLAAKASDSDSDVLSDLMAQHGAVVLAYIRKILDHHTAEDVVQETMIRAWQHWDRLRTGNGSLRGWLLTVAHNLAVDHLRSATARRERSAESIAAIDPGVFAPDHADTVVAQELASELMDEMSPAHRSVLYLMYHADLTVQQTAERLGVPAGTVKSRRHYALSVLRSASPERLAG